MSPAAAAAVLAASCRVLDMCQMSPKKTDPWPRLMGVVLRDAPYPEPRRGRTGVVRAFPFLLTLSLLQDREGQLLRTPDRQVTLQKPQSSRSLVLGRNAALAHIIFSLGECNRLLLSLAAHLLLSSGSFHT